MGKIIDNNIAMHMSAQEYAERYRGRKVRITEEAIGIVDRAHSVAPGFVKVIAVNNLNGNYDYNCYEWWHIDRLELIDDDVLISTNPYPVKCFKCHSPGRQCGLVFMCSNIKCKTRKKFRAAYPSIAQVVELNSKENPILLKCPVCRDTSHIIALYNDSNIICNNYDCRLRNLKQKVTLEVGKWYAHPSFNDELFKYQWR